MSLICSKCGRDLNEIWQDNMSPEPGLVLCEDCSGFTARSKFERQCWEEYERYLSQEFEAYIKEESPCRKGGERVKVDIFNTDKKYQIIYADPPWSYRDKALAGNRGACCKYPVMSIKEICELPIQRIAADDCVLFMWVTMPKLNECFDVITAWGFEYKTCAFTWVKRNKKSDSWFWGMGSWTRANAELCLLATKGKPKRKNASVLSIIDTPVEEHSKKPDIVRERIVQLCGDVPRIELFARQHVDGWDCWGDEV